MLKPSYAELMDVLNKNSNESDEITSRYTIVIAAAKRARQIIEGDEPMVKNRPGKPVSTAVDEILNNKIKVVPEGEGTVLVFNNEMENKINDLDINDIDISDLDTQTNEVDNEEIDQ
ncbi:DNA-directed RNA polymerase subunit omega [[Clostridium] colinum]|uniref:DNA-directed RNA polymerase subunit omega n=1 Tax=[Clostridium] colinum TaxID=36835 RepID=UPI0020244535|nr:DNA-directed RNA polymerase subunit omega [[Clostridium] colinum]